MIVEKLWLRQFEELSKKYLTAHQAWDKTKAIFIKYTGQEATGTVEVQGNSMILSAPGGTPVRTIDFIATGTNTLQEVVADINTALGASGWSAELGDQFDGDENAVDLTVIGATSVKTTGVWFANDTNLKIRVIISPLVTDLVTDFETERIKITNIFGGSTYNLGISRLQLWVNGVKKWDEPWGDFGEDMVSLLGAYTIDEGQVAIIKIINSAIMTNGYLSVAYEIKNHSDFLSRKMKPPI